MRGSEVGSLATAVGREDVILSSDFLSSQFPSGQHIASVVVDMAPIATTLESESHGNASVGALGKTNKSGKPLKIRSYPKFDSLEEERLYRKQHLAAAYRVFAERGWWHP